MSSDDEAASTCGRRTRPTTKQYLVRRIPWRSHYITAILQVIDILYLGIVKPLKSGGVGSNWRDRVRVQRDSNTVKPQIRLPRNFYSTEWLEQRTRSEKILLRIVEPSYECAMLREDISG